jgi:phosphoglycerol transferase MdoB-like AlkP superfamily enzyme
MSIFRGVFFFYYGQWINLSGFEYDILKAFYMGVRYDLAVIADMNALVTLSYIVLLFIEKSEYFNKFLSLLKWYYTFIMGAILVFLCIDFGFYSYFQNHINVLIFGFFEDDTKALISTLNENYNLFLIFLGLILLFTVVFIISKKILNGYIFKRIFYKKIYTNCQQPAIFKKNNISLKISISIILIISNFLCARGTIRNVPLEIDDADVSSNMFLNKVSINGLFTLQAAIDARKKESKGIDLIDKSGYENNIAQAFADFLDKDINEIPKINPENSLIVDLSYNKEIEEIKPNVILIVMESFGSDLLKYNSPEFNVLGELKKHFDEDIVFYNYLPGAGGTMVSLEVIASNIPRRPISMVLAQSQYAYKKYDFSAPIPYNHKNYETSFMYGGGIGWRNAGTFMTNIGFEKVVGEGAMNPEYPRNQWGVYDEHLLDFVFNSLDKNDRKKFMLVMTTTNHPPYSLPKNYKKLPLNIPEDLNKRILDKDLGNKRFAVYQYANDSVGKFITRIKKSKYADNTIVAITGDHNFWGLFEYPTEEIFNSQKVPFYIYIPKRLKPREIDTSVFGSHPDIMPTLYNLSLSNVKYMAMGTNLLSKKASQNIAYNGGDILADKNAFVKYNFQNKNAMFFVWDKNNPFCIIQSSENKDHKRLIKRYLAQTAIADYLIKNAGK